MKLEDRIKLALGEQAFAIIVLSDKLEQATAKLRETEETKQPKPE
jgi:hypothetical protein